MRIFVALLRGINVGGKNVLPMAELKTILAGLGARGVRTYIQSGNVVFRADAKEPAMLGERIGESVEKRCGFLPHVQVLSAERVSQAIAANPFPEAEAEPKSVHVLFLASRPAEPNFDRLEQMKAPGERYVLDGDRFYLHAPEGIARSKLAAGVEKALGVPATARNWRTVGKIMGMIQEAGG